MTLAATCLVLTKKMQARGHCAVTVFENLTMYRNGECIEDIVQEKLYKIPFPIHL